MNKLVDLTSEFKTLYETFADDYVMVDDVCYEIVVNLLLDIQSNTGFNVSKIVTPLCHKHKKTNAVNEICKVISDNLAHIVMKIKSKVQENNNGNKHYHLRYMTNEAEYVISTED